MPIRTFNRRALIPLMLSVSTVGLIGCNNAGQGALSGAAIGAVGGLAIGSLSGDADEGFIIGAVSGAIVGGVIGDQNARQGSHSGHLGGSRQSPARAGRHRGW